VRQSSLALADPGRSRISAPLRIYNDGDFSQHHERLIRANGDCLPVLKLGGNGSFMVFMPGYGYIAHFFDDIASRLRSR
jgi:hypothetical protein